MLATLLSEFRGGRKRNSMKRHLHSSLTMLVCFTLFATMLTGCKKDAEEPEPEPTTGAEIPEPEPEPEVEPEPEPCALETVYFAFDSAELDSSARAALQEAVECYRGQADPGLSLLLTGACDPRGTEEYNIALGERRAQSVRSYLISLGMDGSRISTTSVGEEMATGTDEAGWARDRNVTGSEN
jgi:peptidoglycan-associated lipoprotein